MQFQFLVGRGPVVLDSLYAETQQGCDLLIGMAFGNKLYHAALAGGQRAGTPFGPEGMHRGFDGRTREERLVLRDGVDGRHQQALDIGFENITQGTRLK